MIRGSKLWWTYMMQYGNNDFKEFEELYKLKKINMLDKIRETAIKFSEMGITQFTIKCDEKYLDKLKYDITEKFGSYGNGIPEMDKKIELFICGVKFKAKINSKK
jgi:hypothetical protein